MKPEPIKLICVEIVSVVDGATLGRLQLSKWSEAMEAALMEQIKSAVRLDSARRGLPGRAEFVMRFMETYQS